MVTTDNISSFDSVMFLVPGEPLLLAHAPMNGDGGEVLLDQQLGHGNTALHRLHEDHHLGENVAIQYVHIKRGKTVHMKLETFFMSPCV